jgi:L-lactate dehydrogenase
MKIGVVGCGFVGSTAAFALIMRGIGREIVLVDINTARTQAEADDLFHAVPFAHPLRIIPGDYAALAGCKVVIIAAGVNQKPGETRLQLLERNAAVFRQVIPNILEHAQHAVLVIATNPVDVMTHVAIHIAEELDIPANRVFGSGTTLDTARFRTLLGEYLGVDSQHVHGYVIGEHGDSEVLTWSSVSIGGIPLRDFSKLRAKPIDDEIKMSIDQKVRGAAYNIIAGKDATYYGIGSALARIVEVILKDQRSILTICYRIAGASGIHNVTLSLPHLIGGNGIKETLPLALSDDEGDALMKSANVLKDAITSLKL